VAQTLGEAEEAVRPMFAGAFGRSAPRWSSGVPGGEEASFSRSATVSGPELFQRAGSQAVGDGNRSNTGAWALFDRFNSDPEIERQIQESITSMTTLRRRSPNGAGEHGRDSFFSLAERLRTTTPFPAPAHPP